MADLADVENALVTLIAGIVYPHGTSSPSIVNADVKIYRGWPVAAQLDLDMQGLVLAGTPPSPQPRSGGALTNISVFSPPGMERNTTRYPRGVEITGPAVDGQFPTWTEEKRQERTIQFTCWCPTPALRDALAGPLDLALCQNNFFATSDQSAVRFRYARTSRSDEGEKVQIFRADLFYTVEYPTASVTTAPETTSIEVTTAINGGASQTRTVT